MITHFPSPYPDELVYSLFSRYYTSSGSLTYRCIAEDLFQNSFSKPDIEFVNALTPEGYDVATHAMTWETLIMDHTMFKYYAHFLPLQRRQNAYAAIMNHDGAYHNLLCLPKSNERIPRYLRYCPLCAANDRIKHGETYWHRLHQMHGINVCPTHYCYLNNSSIAISSNGTPALTSAEESVPIYASCLYSNNMLECQLAAYVATAFSAEFIPTASIPPHQYLHTVLEGTKYLSQHGQQRSTAALFDDYSLFYADYPSTPLTQQWQLQKVLSGQRHNMHEICSIGMFLGIDSLALANPLFHNILEIDGPIQHGQHKKPNRGNTHRKDWEHIDASMLSTVSNLLSQLTTKTDAKPIRITMGLIQRLLHLPDKYLDKCPQCKKLIEKYTISQEEHWARLLEWAICKLIAENKPVHMTNLMKLTNLRKEKIIALPLFQQK